MVAMPCPADRPLPRQELVSQAFLQSEAWGGQGWMAVRICPPLPHYFPPWLCRRSPLGLGPQGPNHHPMAASSTARGWFPCSDGHLLPICAAAAVQGSF